MDGTLLGLAAHGAYVGHLPLLHIACRSVRDVKLGQS